MWLTLLGASRVTVDGCVTELPATVGTLLVSFLALRAGWVSRRELAEQAWPDLDERTARTHLRWHLHKVRRVPGLEGIEFERDRVRWLVTSDVEAFLKAFRGERWLEAVEIYEGPLLCHTVWSEASGLTGWLRTERDLLQGLWRVACLKATQVLEAGGRHADGAALARGLIALDALDEEALQRFVTLATACGRADEALAAYGAFEDVLRSEMRLRPLDATRALVESLRLQPATAARAPSGSRLGGQVPHATTSFVGRTRETREIGRLLSDPDCRFLSLTGLGGVGKTRLALEVAERSADAFGDGVVFVPLQAVDESQQVPTAVASALRLAAPDATGDERQLHHHLADRRMLLVLDAVEHVSDALPFLVSLLEYAPGVTLLATSRVRLGAHGEWTYQVDGLASPVPDAPLEPERLRGFGAVELFTNAARREQPAFGASDRDLAAISRIVRALGGLPLGLELAASWTRLLSCTEIADEIERDPDFLRAEDGVALHHRSLRTVFEHSWQALGAGSRRVLCALSLFRADPARDALLHVAEAELRDLLHLSDASLVRSTNGRIGLHEVVRWFALERLTADPGEHAARASRFRAYYADFAARHESALGGANALLAGQAMEREFRNLRVAWDAAVAVEDAHSVSRLLGGLFHLLEHQGRYEEARAILERAERAFAGGASGEHAVLLARLRASRGWACHRRGDNAVAAELLEESLGVLHAEDETSLAAFVATSLAVVLNGMGERDRPERLCEDSLVTCREQHDWSGMGRNLQFLGMFATRASDPERAEARLREALEAYGRASNAAGRGACLNSLGNCSFALGRYGDALDHFAAAVDIAKATGERRSEGMAAMNVGSVHRHTGDRAAAKRWYLLALEILRDIGDAQGTAASLNNLGNLARDAGDLEAAERSFRESLALKRASGASLALVTTLRNLSQVHLLAGDAAQAHAYVDEALAIASAEGNAAMVAEGYVHRGDVEMRLGDVADAHVAFRLALEHALESALAPQVLKALVAIGGSWARLDRPDLVARIVATVRAHHAADHATMAAADALARLLPTVAESIPATRLTLLADEVLAESIGAPPATRAPAAAST